MFWTGEYPPGSQDHETCPYGFKVYAFLAAMRAGYQQILWLDTSVFATKPIDPIFEKIESEGHFMIIGGDKLGNWSSDHALNLFGVTRGAAMDMQLIGGTVLGLDLTNTRTQNFLERWKWHADNGTFIDPGGNKRGTMSGETSADRHPTGSHRHDETVGSLLAYELGMELTWLGNLFQGDGDDVVARSNYE
jgi:hypothetical protein